MKKFLAVIVILLVAVGAFIQFAVPRALTNYLKVKVAELTAAQEVALTLQSMPSAKIAFGYVDNLHCTAANATIGELDLKQAELNGSAIRLDVKELLFPTEGISHEEHTNRILQSAGSLELSGIITAESLRNFLAEKVDRLENPAVTITPESITASGKIKILGRTADIQIGGKIVARDGNLYFQMGEIVDNAVLRRVNLDRFLVDFNLTETVKLPFGMKFTSVEMRDGEAFVKATRN